MRAFRGALLGWLAATLVLTSVGGLEAKPWVEEWRSKRQPWRGVHLMGDRPGSYRRLEESLPSLAAAGVNVIILEVDYSYAFERQPEFRSSSVITREEAGHLVKECHDLGIRLIPQFQCLGHQSWSKTTFPLLTKRPEFDETPGLYPNNEKIYCRSWCPQHPGVNQVVFGLLDEIAEGFQADAIHVGMDEVFLLASDACPRCRGGDPAKLFAKAVNDLHRHIKRERGLEMLMWSDRFLDGKAMGFGEWEAAVNGTAPAVRHVPKDIVMCDWHYEPIEKYPGKPASYSSVAWFAKQGFRVWPTGWKNAQSAAAFSQAAKSVGDRRVLGYLCSTWGAVQPAALSIWPPLTAGYGPWK